MQMPGFYFCISPDVLLSKNHVQELVMSLPENVQKNMVTYTFWPDDLKTDEYFEALTLQSLSAEFKLVVLRSAHTVLAADWKRISSLLATPRSYVLPVFFIESPWEKGVAKIPPVISKLKCFEFAKKQAWVYENIGINEKNIVNYLLKEAKNQNLQLDKEVLQLLSQSAIFDALSIQMLFSQLSLFSQDGDITKEIVTQITAQAPELALFDIIKDMENGNIRKIWSRLSLESDKGESFLFPLIAILARDARILWQLRAGENPYVSPYVKDYKAKQAKKLGFTGITKIFQIVLDADLAVKSGKNAPLQVLESVIISYSNLFAKKGAIQSKIRIHDEEVVSGDDIAKRYM